MKNDVIARMAKGALASAAASVGMTLALGGAPAVAFAAQADQQAVTQPAEGAASEGVPEVTQPEDEQPGAAAVTTPQVVDGSTDEQGRSFGDIVVKTDDNRGSINST